MYGGSGISHIFSRKENIVWFVISKSIQFSVNSMLSKTVLSLKKILLHGLKFLLSETKHSNLFSVIIR
jgi:hypothetical protein